MTIEKRTRTITKDFYIAKDGKEFEDRERCMEYEHELRIKSLKMFDHNFQRTLNIEDARYLYLGTWEELDDYKECCEYLYIEDGGVENIGYYYWDSELDKYINIDDMLANCVILREELKKIC